MLSYVHRQCSTGYLSLNWYRYWKGGDGSNAAFKTFTIAAASLTVAFRSIGPEVRICWGVEAATRHAKRSIDSKHKQGNGNNILGKQELVALLWLMMFRGRAALNSFGTTSWMKGRRHSRRKRPGFRPVHPLSWVQQGWRRTLHQLLSIKAPDAVVRTILARIFLPHGIRAWFRIVMLLLHCCALPFIPSKWKHVV